MRDGVQRRQDVVTLAPRRPRHEQPHQAPQVAQERAVDEVGRIDEQDATPSPFGLSQSGEQLLAQVLRLLLGVALAWDGPDLAPAQANFFFKKARTWDSPRRMPVRRSMSRWASRAVRGGFSRK